MKRASPDDAESRSPKQAKQTPPTFRVCREKIQYDGGNGIRLLLHDFENGHCTFHLRGHSISCTLKKDKFRRKNEDDRVRFQFEYERQREGASLGGYVERDMMTFVQPDYKQSEIEGIMMRIATTMARGFYNLTHERKVDAVVDYGEI